MPRISGDRCFVTNEASLISMLREVDGGCQDRLGEIPRRKQKGRAGLYRRIARNQGNLIGTFDWRGITSLGTNTPKWEGIA